MTTPKNDPVPLDAFVDAELDLRSRLAIEDQLGADPALRQQVDELRQLRSLVREQATYHAAPQALRQRLADAAPGPARPAPPAVRPPPAAAPARGGRSFGVALPAWLGWRPLAASLSFAAVLAVALNVAWLRSTRDERLADEVVASHVRATLGQHLVDVSSSERHTVKPFLSSKLGFSPPVSELPLTGSVFLGGRVDYLDGRPVAALVYKQGEHVVDLFLWPGVASDSRPQFGAERGYRTAHWSRDGMYHWVVSDVNRDEFDAVVKAIAATEIER